MRLTPLDEIPEGKEWVYEVKYDGFRCILIWEKQEPILLSRNGNVLNPFFPEIVQFCNEIYDQICSYLPLIFDGEIVHLLNNFKSDFSTVQSRGRMRNEKNIHTQAAKFPCNYIVFDLLQLKGKELLKIPFAKRRQQLSKLFEAIGIPCTLTNTHRRKIQAIDVFEEVQTAWNLVELHNAEGVVAKKNNSLWVSGQRSSDWVKVKNWRYVTVVLTMYDQNNGFFNGAIYRSDQLVEITVFRHGLTEKEHESLVSFFQTNGRKLTSHTWEIPPSICMEVGCIDFDGKKLREPKFHAFKFEMEPSEVTWQSMMRQLNPLPAKVPMTHPDKPVWPSINLVKDDYLFYLQQIAPYFLPFLQNRLLTTIRFPHGVPGESFYQKNAPDYTPNFVKTQLHEEIDYIVCDDIEALLWLGNQLAIEFHIPFQTIDTNYPTEIVFDLDPPSVNDFQLAIEAALRMKAIFDSFKLQSLIKTSGGKGLQLYIPLPKDTFTYEETRIFTEFVCRFLCEQEPGMFTTERLKKNRNNKLYLDYVQHAEGKTIIAPYSPRGNDKGLVATPLYWDEVNAKLKPDLFSIPAVLSRVKEMGNPFHLFRQLGEQQNFAPILRQLKDLIE